MISMMRTVNLIPLLTLASGLVLPNSTIEDYFENKRTSEHTQFPLEAYNKIGDKSPTSQAVLSYYENVTDEPKQSVLKYGDNKSTSKTMKSINKDWPRPNNMNIKYFDQASDNTESTSKYFHSEGHTSFDGKLYQPGGTDDPKLIVQNVHPKNLLLENKHLEVSDHLASALSQNSDVKNARRSSIGTCDLTMGLSCCNISNSTADCTGCRLTCVPTDLPRNITILLLTDNDISSDELYLGVFANYPQLVELMLDSNKITTLPDGVFEGLEQLETLSLYNNSIALNFELNNSPVFNPLSNTLKTLVLNRNTNDTGAEYLVYPDQALSVLTNLSRLYIDGLRHNYFGIGFLDLTKLTFLKLAGYREGYCNIISITNDTFIYLHHLTYLNISDCNLNGSLIEADAFSSLRKLQVLDASYNFDLGIDAVGKFMYGLRNNKHFERLKIQRIVNRYTPCVVIYINTLKYFKNTGLRVIEAMNNEIEMIELGAFQNLPSSLEMVNLTDNRIMFGAYWKDMAALTGLRELHLDGYFIPEKFPDFFPSKNLQCPEYRTQNYIPNLIVKQDPGNEECVCGTGTCSSETQEFILPLPPKLQVLTMHSKSLEYSINDIKFCTANNLTTADLSDNTFKHLDGSVKGLNHIKNLTLASCFIETISGGFFDNLSSLEYLNLYQNLLGDCLDADKTGNIFDTLNNLKYMNLSFNNLYRLNDLSFKNMENLEILDLSVNRISHVNFSIKHMNHIQVIDLHKNDITTLPLSFRDVIDNILNANKKVRIDLRDNPINCDCPNLEFLQWVVSRKVFVGNFSNYYCKYREGSQTATPMDNGYDEEVAKLTRACSTHVGLFVGVVGGTLLLVLVIIGLLLYRFRWTLRYWFHAAKMKIYTNPHQVSEDFEYDVFISYASEDVNFVLQELSPHLSAERHLKLMIHGEKFQAGRHITDNIYMAVQQCRKTLVLVTKQMLASHWCSYELQMARMESITTGREVLVFLFLEEIPTNLMNAEVMSYIKTSTYVFYPTESQHREAFWNKLADDLRAR